MARMNRRPAWYQGWLPLIVLPLVVSVVEVEWPRWGFMWVLAFALYVGCKWLTWRRTPTNSPAWRQAAYLLAWPGMDAVAFLNSAIDLARRPHLTEWLFVVAKISFGFVILFALVPLVPADQPYTVGWVGMVGLMFVLHFGLFHMLACGWRTFGLDAKPLMDWPLLATSSSDFWGKRWNTAFRDLTHRFLFRPAVRRFGPRMALVLGFVFSGIVHDLVISFPAGAGYGGPTLYFLLQGVALFVERSATGKRFGLGAGWRGWFFTALTLLLPAPLLFHPPFVERIIVPFLQFMGATS